MSPPPGGDPITPKPESQKARRRRIRAEKAQGITGADKAHRPDNQPIRRDHRPKPAQPNLQQLNRAHAKTRVGPPPKPAKPKVGRGQYIAAPRLQDKAKSARWQANALVNNPAVGGTLLAGGAVGAAQSQKKNWSKKAQDRTDVATGAVVGGGVGEVARQQGFYATKRSSAKSRKTWSKNGDLGPYKEGPHKQTLRNLEHEAGQYARRQAKPAAKPSARVKLQYFADNFPKDVPGSKARRIGNAISTPKAVAGTLGTSAVLGGGLVALNQKRVKKSMGAEMGISAFGVDHGYDEIAKYDLDPKDPSGKKATGGRRAAAYLAGPFHSGVAGKKGKKLRATGNAWGGAMAGSVAGNAIGLAATKGKLTPAARAGGFGGAITGSTLGVNRNQRKGYYKKQDAGAM